MPQVHFYLIFTSERGGLGFALAPTGCGFLVRVDSDTQSDTLLRCWSPVGFLLGYWLMYSSVEFEMYDLIKSPCRLL
jgi:hypothetical protein